MNDDFFLHFLVFPPACEREQKGKDVLVETGRVGPVVGAMMPAMVSKVHHLHTHNHRPSLFCRW